MEEKKMQLANKKVITTILIAILLGTFAAIQIASTVNAKVEQIGAPQLAAWPTAPPSGVTPNVTIATTAFMSLSPNPIGQGQSVLINLWLEPPVAYQRYFSGYTVTITKPNNTTE